jgi:hypothetical protein
MESFATILTGVLVALATAFFTSRFYVHQATTDLRNEYERRFNERKWNAYTGFAETIRDVLKSMKGQSLDQDLPRVLDRIYDFMSALWLVGSDDVIRSVLRWRKTSGGGVTSDGGRASLRELANIIIEMRKDLGNTATALDAKDILGTFINDVDQFFADERTRKATPTE